MKFVQYVDESLAGGQQGLLKKKNPSSYSYKSLIMCLWKISKFIVYLWLSNLTLLIWYFLSRKNLALVTRSFSLKFLLKNANHANIEHANPNQSPKSYINRVCVFVWFCKTFNACVPNLTNISCLETSMYNPTLKSIYLCAYRQNR